uniref:Uncharacterized protein n=1 Tax=Chaetoceros debilis TaxID=122233 RepID=A0A7S3VAF9_9STRA|mmetsp:Transcript_15539/g.23274  ORF Transcript_15539/g.23274 Transcript_15539/m.23274 type:complete len:101 (+) Transcript_15539:77-379(+)
MACDNESAWKTFFAEDDPAQSDCSCDPLYAIKHQINESSLEWKGKWVKGHQDKDTKNLDQWAIKNIAVDVAAGEYWRKTVRDLIPVDQAYYWKKNGRVGR